MLTKISELKIQGHAHKRPIILDYQFQQQHQLFTRIEESLAPHHFDFIQNHLNQHFIFSQLRTNPSSLLKLLHKFFMCQVQQGCPFIIQNSRASTFFLLYKGEVQISVGGQFKRMAREGEGIGELGLIYNAPRSATCKARKQSIFFCINRKNFRQTLEQINQINYDQNRKIIDQVKFFQCLSSNNRDSLAFLLNNQFFHPHATILTEGQLASSFYIIKSGVVQATLKGKLVGKLKSGESFGQNALLAQGQRRNMSVKAQSQVVLLSLGRAQLSRLLGRDLHVMIFRNKVKLALSKSSIFSKLSSLQLQKIIDSLQIHKAEAKELLCQPGQLARNNIFLVLQGSCLYNGAPYDYRGKWHGQLCVLQSQLSLKYDFTIQMTQLGTVARFNFSTLCSQLRDKYETASLKSRLSRSLIINFNQTLLAERDRFSQLKLHSFRILYRLGMGQFGKVYAVENQGERYAIKCVSKGKIIQSRLQRHLKNQLKVLETMQTPFLIKFLRSYKDADVVYFLTQLVDGQELFNVMAQEIVLPESFRKFCVASLTLILQGFYQRNIIYRDLKPQNIMVRKNGYLCLIDMGTSKLVKAKGNPRSFTIIGTPHYMSPEALSGKGYTYCTDLWSLGVCMHQFMTGELPFGNEESDPYNIYSAILKNHMQLSIFKQKGAQQELLTQLLSIQPEGRLGGSFQSLKSRPWFKQIDWEQLSGMKAESPYRPREAVREEEDISWEQVRQENRQEYFRKDFEQDWDALF